MRVDARERVQRRLQSLGKSTFCVHHAHANANEEQRHRVRYRAIDHREQRPVRRAKREGDENKPQYCRRIVVLCVVAAIGRRHGVVQCLLQKSNNNDARFTVLFEPRCFVARVRQRSSSSSSTRGKNAVETRDQTSKDYDNTAAFSRREGKCACFVLWRNRLLF